MEHMTIPHMLMFIVMFLVWITPKPEAAEGTKKTAPLRTGCRFQGKWIANSESKHIGFGKMPYCMKCTCVDGKITCIYGVRDGEVITQVSCSTKKACAAAAVTLSRECRRDVGLNCYSSPPLRVFASSSYQWDANGCRYACGSGSTKNKILSSIKQRPWCQSLSWTKQCAICPDKKSFLEQYNHTIATCHSGRIIRRDSLCNGLKDCLDGSDELNCTRYYCRLNVEEIVGKRFFWGVTATNVTKSLQCRTIHPGWRGVLKRTCVLENMKPTWTKIDVCQCTYSRPDPIEMDSVNQTLDVIATKAEKLKDFAKTAAGTGRIVELGLFLATQALALECTDVERYLLFNIAMFLSTIHRRSSGCGPKAIENERMLLKKLIEFKRKIGSPYFGGPGGHTELLLWYKNRFTYQDVLIPEVILLPGVIEVGSVQDVHAPMPLVGEYQRRVSIMKNSTNATNITSSNITRKTYAWKRRTRTSYFHENILFIMDIGFGVMSLVALSIAVGAMFLLDVPASTKLFIHKNLFAALLITYLVYITATLARKSLKENTEICFVIAFVQYYFSLARYSWMTVEGVNLFIVVVLVFQTRTKKHCLYAMSGWGGAEFPCIINRMILEASIRYRTPLIPLFITMVVESVTFHKNAGCLSLNTWLYKGPVAVLLTANVALFSVVLWMVLRNISSSQRLNTTPQRLRSSVKAFITLVPLLGICQILGFAIEFHKIIFSYLYVTINGTLGLLFTYLHCFQDPQSLSNVTKQIIPRTVCWFGNSNYTYVDAEVKKLIQEAWKKLRGRKRTSVKAPQRVPSSQKVPRDKLKYVHD